MFVSLIFLVLSKGISVVVGWDPSNFTFNPGDKYEFENVGPIKAIIDGQPAYSPNPKHWTYKTGLYIDEGLQKFNDSVQNAYIQNG